MQKLRNRSKNAFLFMGLLAISVMACEMSRSPAHTKGDSTTVPVSGALDKFKILIQITQAYKDTGKADISVVLADSLSASSPLPSTPRSILEVGVALSDKNEENAGAIEANFQTKGKRFRMLNSDVPKIKITVSFADSLKNIYHCQYEAAASKVLGFDRSTITPKACTVTAAIAPSVSPSANADTQTPSVVPSDTPHPTTSTESSPSPKTSASPSPSVSPITTASPTHSPTESPRPTSSSSPSQSPSPTT